MKTLSKKIFKVSALKKGKKPNKKMEDIITTMLDSFSEKDKITTNIQKEEFARFTVKKFCEVLTQYEDSGDYKSCYKYFYTEIAQAVNKYYSIK